jgi:hypothetical protein
LEYAAWQSPICSFFRPDDTRNPGNFDLLFRPDLA